MSREIMQEAVIALDIAQSLLEQSRHHNQILGAYEALRQALAQPEQTKYSDIVSDGGFDPRNKFDAQPEQFVVAFPSFMRKRIEHALKDAIHPKGMSSHDGKVKVLVSDLSRMLLVIDSAPPKREWVGLTDDVLNSLVEKCAKYYGYEMKPIQTAGFYALVKAIEAKLKEKNNAV